MGEDEALVASRRALAMVATEAAMQRERDPVRYRRLERRNALAAGTTTRPLSVLQTWPTIAVVQIVDPYNLEPSDPNPEWEFEDTVWLTAVDCGFWAPNRECSNCLVRCRTVQLGIMPDGGLGIGHKTVPVYDHAWALVHEGDVAVGCHVAAVANLGGVELAGTTLLRSGGAGYTLQVGNRYTFALLPGMSLYARILETATDIP